MILSTVLAIIFTAGTASAQDAESKTPAQEVVQNTALQTPASANGADLEEQEITLENSVSLRDPFRRPAIKVTDALAEAASVPELERHDVDQLRLVGIITGPKKNKALLSTPDGKMFVVTENSRIGTRRGLVKKITPGELLIEEKVLNLLGQEEKIEASIKFSEKDKK